MGMGDDQAVNAVLATGYERRVRHLDAGASGCVAGPMFKGNATIDQQPPTLVSVQVEVHADFARATQWQEPGGIGRLVHTYQA